VIDLATNSVIGSPIAVGSHPFKVAITAGRTLTPAEHVALLKTAVAELLAAGSLNQKQASALTERLDHALGQLVVGHTLDAVRQLQRFVNNVNRLVNEAVLTATEAQPLLDNANAVIWWYGGGR